MSTLIERMIRRTQAPLSSLEPLSRPQFGEPQSQSLWRESDVVGTETTSELPDFTDAAGRPQRPRTHSRVPSEEVAPLPRVADATPTSQLGDAGRSQAEARHPNAATTLRPPSIPAWHLNQAESKTAPEVGIEERPTPASAKPDAGLAMTTVAVPAEVLPTHRNRTPESFRPPQSWRQPAAQADDSGPAVTISIGHIEVRAAPPIEPSRPRPQFTPLVSLEDFLIRRQDRRR